MAGAITFAHPVQQEADNYRHRGMRRKLADLLRTKGIRSDAVLEAMMEVPRHLFLDDSALLELAYEDKALPIACGQTISQPYTVAFQTELLQVQRGHKVLEIGTGSGYQTAVLCKLGAKVVSIERQRGLYVRTRERLEKLGFEARLSYGDGYKGAPALGPFDRVLVTCGAPFVPEALLEQLKVGGRLVIPVGEGADQTMWAVDKLGPAEYKRTDHGNFRFVPMLEEKAGG